MSKARLGAMPLLYPMPALLIGADVDGQANFMTAAWGGVANAEPPMLTVAVRPSRHTLEGIRKNGVFSVNVPSSGQFAETDYCGIVSGKNEDKLATLGWETFKGDLEHAPLIKQCPVNLECRLHQELDLGCHILVVGEIVQVHVSEECLTEGKPDPMKVDPLVYVSGTAKSYAKLGGIVGPAFKAGLAYKK